MRSSPDSGHRAGDYDRGMTVGADRARLHPQVQDVLLAAFVTFAHIRGTLQLVPAQEAARPLDEPAHLGFALLAASGAVLIVRRRWPVAVFTGVVAASCVYYAAGYPDGPAWLALFVASYTLTAYGDGRRSVRIATVGLTVLAVVSLLTADLQPLLTAGWVFFRIGTAVMAAALGESVRTRKVIAGEAEERAERAERAHEDEARRRVDAERLRIAREVHDTVAHAVAVVNVQAGVTAHVLDKRPEQAREALVTIERTSARALRELRAILGVLRDHDEDQPGADGGLDRLDELTAMARTAGLDVTVDVASPRRELPSAVDRAAYRIVQESLTNVIRHADAAHVGITIDYGQDELAIEVVDDGSGTTSTGGTGHGIEGMRERCTLLGGELSAGPGQDGGFRVLARLPLAAEPAVAR